MGIDLFARRPAELGGPRRSMLDIHKNPLLVSILNSCEMLKALDAKGELPLNHMVNSRALLFMKADKVGVANDHARCNGVASCVYGTAG